MISAKEYELLTILKEKRSFKSKDYMNEIDSLLSKNYIYRSQYRMPNIRERHTSYFALTPAGESAYEEYTYFLREQELKEQTLILSKQSNEIAKRSNRLSIAAIIVSAISVVASLLIGFLT